MSCTSVAAGRLDTLVFDDSYVRELPGDPESTNTVRAVYGACHSLVVPTPVAAPRLLACSREAAALIGLDAGECATPRFAEVFAGNALLPGMRPHAACYGGHQFGQWAGQLGDGRAIVLGEVLNAGGARWTLQLKGAGRTPYSRSADGRAVLRSSIREFLCSEAMHHLGVPTTRALSLVVTGEGVLRDMLYDGNPQIEPGAVVCRLAPSFIRFGHFELFTARGDEYTLGKLADYTLRLHFPELGAPSPATYVAWFHEICRRTARLVVEWTRVGFVHGVMNTDNMSVHGLTLDYGPYGWLEDYDPLWTPNTTDAAGRRYCFGNQPGIAQWNLARLAAALRPLIPEAEALQEGIDRYARTYAEGWRAMMAAKLGLSAFEAEDAARVETLFDMLRETPTDMTLFFRGLAELAELPGGVADDAPLAPLRVAWYAPPAPAARERLLVWLRALQMRYARDGRPPEERRAAMNRVNPLYVPRNYLVQQVIDRAEQGDTAGIAEMLDVLRHPYVAQPGREGWAAPRPEWARNRVGCSMLSCSS